MGKITVVSKAFFEKYWDNYIEKALSHKYIRKIPDSKGGWHYIYPKDFARPLKMLLSVFGLKEEKIDAAYEKQNIQAEYGATKKDFASHLLEYLSNRNTWNKFFGDKFNRDRYKTPVKFEPKKSEIKEKVENGEIKNNGKITDKTGKEHNETKEKDFKTKWNNTLMRKIYSMYNSVPEDKKVETVQNINTADRVSANGVAGTITKDYGNGMVFVKFDDGSMGRMKKTALQILNPTNQEVANEADAKGEGIKNNDSTLNTSNEPVEEKTKEQKEKEWHEKWDVRLADEFVKGKEKYLNAKPLVSNNAFILFNKIWDQIKDKTKNEQIKWLYNQVKDDYQMSWNESLAYRKEGYSKEEVRFGYINAFLETKNPAEEHENRSQAMMGNDNAKKNSIKQRFKVDHEEHTLDDLKKLKTDIQDNINMLADDEYALPEDRDRLNAQLEAVDEMIAEKDTSALSQAMMGNQNARKYGNLSEEANQIIENNNLPVNADGVVQPTETELKTSKEFFEKNRNQNYKFGKDQYGNYYIQMPGVDGYYYDEKGNRVDNAAMIHQRTYHDEYIPEEPNFVTNNMNGERIYLTEEMKQIMNSGDTEYHPIDSTYVKPESDSFIDDYIDTISNDKNRSSLENKKYRLKAIYEMAKDKGIHIVDVHGIFSNTGVVTNAVLPLGENDFHSENAIYLEKRDAKLLMPFINHVIDTVEPANIPKGQNVLLSNPEKNVLSLAYEFEKRQDPTMSDAWYIEKVTKKLPKLAAKVDNWDEIKGINFGSKMFKDADAVQEIKDYAENVDKEENKSTNKVKKDFDDLVNVLTTGNRLELESKKAGSVILESGETGKSGFGLKHIIEQRYIKDGKSEDEIVALIHLILEAVRDGEITRENNRNLELSKNGIVAILRKEPNNKGFQWVLTGFDNTETDEVKKEATDAITTVIANNSYTPEFSSFRNQVGAVIASINNNTSNSDIVNTDTSKLSEAMKGNQNAKKDGLDENLIRNANGSSFMYEAGDAINREYLNGIDTIDSLNISDEEKEKAKQKLYELSTEELKAQAENISVYTAGPARKVPGSDKAFKKVQKIRGEKQYLLNELGDKSNKNNLKEEKKNEIDVLSDAIKNNKLAFVKDGKVYYRNNTKSGTWNVIDYIPEITDNKTVDEKKKELKELNSKKKTLGFADSEKAKTLDKIEKLKSEIAFMNTDEYKNRSDAMMGNDNAAGEHNVEATPTVENTVVSESKMKKEQKKEKEARKKAGLPNPGNNVGDRVSAIDDADTWNPNSENYRFKDTGYIAGSRKELASMFIMERAKRGERIDAHELDFDGLEENPRAAEKLITKSNIFGEVDWDGLRKKGMSGSTAFLIDRIYVSAGSKPDESNAQARKQYVIALNGLRDRFEDCKTVPEVIDTLKEIREEIRGEYVEIKEMPEYKRITERMKSLNEIMRNKRDELMSLSQQGSKNYEVEKQKIVEKYIQKGKDEKLLRWNTRVSVYNIPKQYQEEFEKETKGLWDKAYEPWKKAVADFKAELISRGVKEEDFFTGKKNMAGKPIEVSWYDYYTLMPEAQEYGALSSELDAYIKKMKVAVSMKNPLLEAWKSLGKRFTDILYSDSFNQHKYECTKGTYDNWEWLEKEVKVTEKKTGKEKKKFQLLVANEITRKGGRDFNVTSTEDLKKSFNLRDVQSGNWVLKDPASAEFHVRNAAQAFADLADVTGISDDKISLNGRLAMAFGARGTGGFNGTAAAHYEPIERVINLTKFHGGGSLGHEWFHAFDNMITSAMTGDDSISDTYLTNVYHGLSESNQLLLREYIELQDADSTYTNVYRRNQLARQLEKKGVDLKKIKGEKTALQFKIQTAFDDLVKAMTVGNSDMKMNLTYEGKDYKNMLRNMSDDSLKFYRDRYSVYSGDRKPMQLLIADAGSLDGAIAKINERYESYKDAKSLKNKMEWLRIAAAYYDRQPDGNKNGIPLRVSSGRKVSQFLSDANDLDMNSGKNYWSTTHEMAARAFSAYLYDTLNDMGRQNDYLAYATENKYYEDNPYPEGEERKRINAAFKKLFEVVNEQKAIQKAIDILDKFVIEKSEPRFIIKGGRFLIRK